MSLIQIYNTIAGGMNSIIVKDSWQVLTLNYSDDYHINNTKQFFKHEESDKGISILYGSALLITINDVLKSDFSITTLERGSSYNIPKKTWYVIVMSRGSQLVIVEKPYTQIEDIDVLQLNETQLKRMFQNINEEYKN